MNEIKSKNEEIYHSLLGYFENHYEEDQKFLNELKSKWGWEEREKQNRGNEENESKDDEEEGREESKEWENSKISRVYIHEIKLKLKHLADLITIFDKNKK